MIIHLKGQKVKGGKSEMKIKLQESWILYFFFCNLTYFIWSHTVVREGEKEKEKEEKKVFPHWGETLISPFQK